MIDKFRALLQYRMAFSHWLWLYAGTMVLLLTISVVPELVGESDHKLQSTLLTCVLAVVAILFTVLTIRYFQGFMGRIERFARSIACGNLETPLPLKHDRGEVARILSALNQMQSQLRDSFKHLRSEEQHNALLVQAINQSSNSVMVTDLQAKIIYVNDAFVDNSGYEREEILGHTPKLIQSGKTPAEVYSKMRELLRKGETWRGELINKRKDGSEFIETVTITPVRDHHHEIYRYMAVKEDVTEIRRAQDSIERLAYFDPLTDLPNRRYFLDQLNRRIAHAKRHQGKFSLLFIDLNRFKEINDSQGHVVGDKVLVEVAERFAKEVREEDVLARLGGDEFVLLVDEVETSFIAKMVERLLATLRYGVRVSEGRFDISASVGVSLYPRHGTNSADLLRHADVAMYQAKVSQSALVVYDRSMSERVERDVVIAGRLQQTLRDGEGLELYVQGQFELSSGALSGAEVLLRWHDTLIGTISPSDFIPIAEERGLIASLDRFVIAHSCQALAHWREQGYPMPVPLSVNVSMALFEEKDFVEWLQQILSKYALGVTDIELEITESGLMLNPEGALNTASQLGSIGMSLAIDDFGTGYSSLAYLKQFNAAKVKVDQAFIRDIDSEDRSQAIVRATISMVRELGMQVLAEGVETEQEASWLRRAGCQFVQGYKYARPEPLEAFANHWLRLHD